MHLCFHAVIIVFFLCDRQSLKLENENINTKTEVSYMGLEFKVYIETNAGWLELSLTQTNFHGPSLFKQLKFDCTYINFIAVERS